MYACYFGFVDVAFDVVRSDEGWLTGGSADYEVDKQIGVMHGCCILSMLKRW